MRERINANPELEDTREFTDGELMELGLIIEFFRKHPEFKWPRGFPYRDLKELAMKEAPNESSPDL